jgi:hypothetical protein
LANGPGAAWADLAISPFSPEWSDVSDPFYPLHPGPFPNPVLTAADVTDYDASFVADPFLFHENGVWYMFFEVSAGLGRVGLATSPDGFAWTYDRVVFSETNHLSYPQVFKWFDSYYMIPEQAVTGTVKLYKATNFPYDWEYMATLISGRQIADPTIFYYRGVWYLFGAPTSDDRLYLYFSHNLLTGWVQHPMSPVATGRDRCRPAGRVTLFDTNRIVRVAQKCDVIYGQGVRAFQIDSLSTVYYHEHEIPESPILFASGAGWNRDGMHQCDPWWNGECWIVSTDGYCDGIWAIGIYLTTPLSAAPFPAATGGLRLDPGCPQPFRDQTTLSLELPASSAGSPGLPDPASGPVDLSIYDSGGRIVCTLLHDPLASGRVQAVWRGIDRSGRPVPAGRYFARLSRAGQTASQGLILVR